MNLFKTLSSFNVLKEIAKPINHIFWQRITRGSIWSWGKRSKAGMNSGFVAGKFYKRATGMAQLELAWYERHEKNQHKMVPRVGFQYDAESDVVIVSSHFGRIMHAAAKNANGAVFVDLLFYIELTKTNGHLDVVFGELENLFLTNYVPLTKCTCVFSYLKGIPSKRSTSCLCKSFRLYWWHTILSSH